MRLEYPELPAVAAAHVAKSLGYDKLRVGVGDPPITAIWFCDQICILDAFQRLGILMIHTANAHYGAFIEWNHRKLDDVFVSAVIDLSDWEDRFITICDANETFPTAQRINVLDGCNFRAVLLTTENMRIINLSPSDQLLEAAHELVKLVDKLKDMIEVRDLMSMGVLAPETRLKGSSDLHSFT